MKLSRCPICESKKMKIVNGEISFQTPEGEVIVPNITRQRCLSCGEEFFNHQANLALDEFRGHNTYLSQKIGTSVK